jgi:uncharacterized ferredoxin-like protein
LPEAASVERILSIVVRGRIVAARTAPKTAGIDDILTLIVYGQEKDAIAGKMEEITEERKIEAFKRDAKNVRNSEEIVMIGLRGSRSASLNCGSCGYKSCKEFEAASKSAAKISLGQHAFSRR